MLGHELEQIIEQYDSIKSNFLGVVSIDTLPRNIPLNHFLFCNEDFAQNKGTHWLCFVRTSKEKVECFDSLSINGNKEKLLEKYCCFKNVKKIKYNKTVFQPFSSKNCGLYACYFGINRMHNLDLSFNLFLGEYFSSNLEENEKMVIDFFT